MTPRGGRADARKAGKHRSMREDPRSLSDQLLEDAEDMLRGLQALQQEVRSLLADVSQSGKGPHTWTREPGPAAV